MCNTYGDGTVLVHNQVSGRRGFFLRKSRIIRMIGSFTRVTLAAFDLIWDESLSKQCDLCGRLLLSEGDWRC